MAHALVGLRYLGGVLADQPYLADDTFPMADIMAFARLGLADFAQVPIPNDCTNLRVWQACVAEQPSIAG